MLTFIGLGLYDVRDISLKGLDAVRKADVILLERYTSLLTGSTHEKMEAFYGKHVRLLSRGDVEQHPEDFLSEAETKNVAFLTAGDPMVSTTHIDLRMRAAARGIATAIIHGASISSAVSGLSGLQNYRFGKSCSLPFPYKNWSPVAPVEVIARNREAGLHTIVYLDIQENQLRLMRFNQLNGFAYSLCIGNDFHFRAIFLKLFAKQDDSFFFIIHNDGSYHALSVRNGISMETRVPAAVPSTLNKSSVMKARRIL